jgi:hypothetical protein
MGHVSKFNCSLGTVCPGHVYFDEAQVLSQHFFSVHLPPSHTILSAIALAVVPSPHVKEPQVGAKQHKSEQPFFGQLMKSPLGFLLTGHV